MHRQGTLGFGRGGTIPLGEFSAVGRGRVFRRVEDFSRLGVLVQFRMPEIHRRHVHRHVDAAGLGVLVVGHLAGRGLEFSAPRRQSPKVIRLEAGISVIRIESVGDRRCKRSRTDQRGQRRQGNTVH